MKNRIKRGASLKKLLEWISAHPVRRSIIVVVDGPKLPSHIAKEAAKRCGKINLKISNIIRDFQRLGIMRCLTPKLKNGEKGRVFDFTNKGLEIKRVLCGEEGKKSFYSRLRGVNWYKYGWVISGSQKIALFKILDINIAQTLHEIMEKTKEQGYKTRPQRLHCQPGDEARGITRMNLFDILKKAITEKLVERKEEIWGKKRKRGKYKLTKEGGLIKEQILKLPNFK